MCTPGPISTFIRPRHARLLCETVAFEGCLLGRQEGAANGPCKLSDDGNAQGEIRAAGLGYAQVLGSFVATRE